MYVDDIAPLDNVEILINFIYMNVYTLYRDTYFMLMSSWVWGYSHVLPSDEMTKAGRCGVKVKVVTISW